MSLVPEIAHLDLNLIPEGYIILQSGKFTELRTEVTKVNYPLQQ